MAQPTYLEVVDENEAIKQLETLGCSDGLPVVVPTGRRVDDMILAGGMGGDISLGTVPPRGGDATVATVAANAVMAGCIPDHFPVVLAAVRSALHPQLDLAEMQATTNPVSPLVIVNGPARHLCGPIASGHGALGPGHRANATIGRALRLVLMNVGGALPGDGDMALLGHGGKFAACLAEAEEESPFEPLHRSLGWRTEESTATVVGADAPQAVVFAPTDDPTTSAEMLLRLLGTVLASPTHVGTYSAGGSDVVVFNPGHAYLLASAGHDRASITAILATYSQIRVGELRRANPGVLASAGSFVNFSDDAVVSACNPDRLLLLVAGAPGAYSFVLRSWGVGPHLGAFATTEIELDQRCVLPLTKT